MCSSLYFNYLVILLVKSYLVSTFKLLERLLLSEASICVIRDSTSVKLRMSPMAIRPYINQFAYQEFILLHK